MPTEGKTLFDIPVENIAPNPHNPRLIFDEQEMDDLKQSIKKVGILVPVTVYKNTKKVPATDFVLLDGERRWRCAKEIGLTAIPANVIDEPKDVTQNILFMFNIHHYRREWELFPTALKLEKLFESLGTDNETTVSNFTGVKRATIRRCKSLLWFPLKYRTTLMEMDSKISTDFFIELYPVARRLSAEDEFSFPQGTERLTDGIIAKFEAGTVFTDVKDLRNVRRAMAFFDRRGNFPQFKKQMSEFITEPRIGMEVFALDALDDEKTIANLLRQVGFVNRTLKETDPDLLSDLVVVDELKRLQFNIENFLTSVE